jgi:hypothetical protein
MAYWFTSARAGTDTMKYPKEAAFTLARVRPLLASVAPQGGRPAQAEVYGQCRTSRQELVKL